jgi:hypothetical protein
MGIGPASIAHECPVPQCYHYQTLIHGHMSVGHIPLSHMSIPIENPVQQGEANFVKVGIRLDMGMCQNLAIQKMNDTSMKLQRIAMTGLGFRV